MKNPANKILDQINSKEMEGYKYLYDNYYPSLCNFATKFLRHREDAKDIVQDVFVKIWKGDSTFDSMRSLTFFLYVAVKNSCLNAVRSYARWSDTDITSDNDIMGAEEDKPMEHLLIEEEFYRQIYVAINNLSPERRDVILLSMEDYTNKEIADRLKVSINTVKTLKLKSYRVLRGILSPQALTILPLFLFK